MAELYIIKHETLAEIAKAVRAKNGTTAEIAVSDLASEISSISMGSAASLQTKNITFTEYGNSTLSPSTGYTGISKFTINSNLKCVEKVFQPYKDSADTERPSILLTATERAILAEGRGELRLYNPVDPEDPANMTKRE
jgi:hypothetical protein